jgi:hypothetical protein
MRLRTIGGFGNSRYSRFGNLRYRAGMPRGTGRRDACPTSYARFSRLPPRSEFGNFKALHGLLREPEERKIGAADVLIY